MKKIKLKIIKSLIECFENAISCDPISYFGGIVAFNKKIDLDVAKQLIKPFLECIICPDIDDEALETLKMKKNLRIILYNQVFNLPYTIIRPSALYGERCVSRRVGQIFIENALYKKEIIINSDDDEKLDFTYINDLIHGIEKVIENENSVNQIFNITFGEGRKISTLIDILNNYFGNIQIKKKKRDKLTPKRGKLLCQKAEDLIGYSPSWDLEKGYSNYIKWYIDFFEKNKSILNNK